MKTLRSNLRAAAFATAVALSLGFGAAQALAAPAPEEAAAPRCESICVFQCGAPGGRPIYGGICICCLPKG